MLPPLFTDGSHRLSHGVPSYSGRYNVRRSVAAYLGMRPALCRPPRLGRCSGRYSSLVMRAPLIRRLLSVRSFQKLLVPFTAFVCEIICIIGWEPAFVNTHFSETHRPPPRNRPNLSAGSGMEPAFSHSVYSLNTNFCRIFSTAFISRGFAVWAFMPQSRQRWTSSENASAVMAIMGMSASGRPELRVAFVAS